MTRSSRILAIVAAVFALLIALVVLVPLLFRDRIAERVKVAVNRNINAQVDWQRVGLSLFRDFPNLTLSLDDLTAVGTGPFQADTLARVRHLRASVGLGSVLGNVFGGRPIEVRSIDLDQPRLRLIRLADGAANWNITKKKAGEPEAEASKPMAISLQHFEISDGDVALADRKSGLDARIIGWDHSLSGDFSRDLVTVKTKADADSVSVSFAGIPYLSEVRLALNSEAAADLRRKSYTLKATEVRLNDLKLAVAGSANTAGKNTGLDLTFNAPSTDFRSILSLVPAVYAHDFDKVKTSGTFAVNGSVKGEYGDDAFPSFALNAKVNDAAFQYPDLPLPARSIFLDLAMTNAGGSADNTVVRLDRFHVQLGANPVDASLVLRTPVSDPDVDAQVKGKVDLADVRRTVKLEGIEQLAGIISADATVKAKKSYLDRNQYDRVAASGNIDVANVTVRGKALPKPLAVRQASLTVSPQRAQLKSFNGTIGNSDVQASGTLEQMLGYAFRDDTLRGNLSVRSTHFDLDEWRSDTAATQVIPVPPRLDLGLDVEAGEMTYGKLKMANAKGRVRVKDQRATLEQFAMKSLGGQLGVSGFYETTNLAKPTFDVAFRMLKVDIPSAFQSLVTVQKLAPVAKYASGEVTTVVHLAGGLGKDMMPLFQTLSGNGSLQTDQLALHDFPGMQKIVDVTKLAFLDNPTMRDIKANFQVRDGRLVMQPFDVKVGPTTITVAGSNGFDQTLDYTLGLKVPSSVLGSSASHAITALLARAGQAGASVGGAATIPLNIKLGGTVSDPSVQADVSSLASSLTTGAQQAVTGAVSAEALQLIQAAEKQAAGIRQQSQTLADKLKLEGYEQADSVKAKGGTNPLTAMAATTAAAELRKQTDQKAAAILEEGNKRADSLLAAAKRQVGQAGGGSKPDTQPSLK